MYSWSTVSDQYAWRTDERLLCEADATANAALRGSPPSAPGPLLYRLLSLPAGQTLTWGWVSRVQMPAAERGPC